MLVCALMLLAGFPPAPHPTCLATSPAVGWADESPGIGDSGTVPAQLGRGDVGATLNVARPPGAASSPRLSDPLTPPEWRRDRAIPRRPAAGRMPHEWAPARGPSRPLNTLLCIWIV